MSSSENKFYVYALIDPINNLPFYFGKGFGKRMYTHLKGHANYNEKKLNLIRMIRLLGHEPYAEIVKGNLTEKEALELELFAIKTFKKDLNLTNFICQPPSRTGSKLTEEHKQRLREVNKGKTLTDDHKRKIGLSNKARAANSSGK